MRDRSDGSVEPDGLVDTTTVVTGGGGFLGRAVLPELAKSYPGRIISITRQPLVDQRLPESDSRVHVLADLRETDKWIGLLREADFVIWMASLRDHGTSTAAAIRENVDPLRAALATLREQPRFRRFVFASSISALDQPNHPHRPRPLTDHSTSCPRTPYGYSKRQSELLLAASRVPHTVLRLPFLYGPGFRSGSFLDFYRRVAQTPALSALRFTANLSLLYTGDVARILLQILDPANSAAADSGPYVLSDGSVYEVDELISMVAEVHGLTRPRLRAPASLGTIASEVALAARRLTRPRPVARSNARLLFAYWSHAAFTRNYFVVDSSRFHAAFPGSRHTPVHGAIARSFPDGRPA
ncbi:MAG TPA: NAD(P)-dependent oxidoreductase [Thermoleophilaceae bacterium]|nr:NAD(P)-dependent oxidoreductase [Thermoleophilaceae bacterium]